MIDYSTHTLDNGLRVVHHYDPMPSHVCLNLLYNVGARDEEPHLTGMAHLFEHLMFGGSANVASYDYELEMAGGHNNAWTSNDFTNFYDVLPRENIATAFWTESDRMLALNFDEKTLEVQRGVVIEEFKQTCLNKPYGDIAHHLRSLIYNSHPYRYPTIGQEISHIERVTMDDVKRFFYSHYAPNNAVLAVAGPISLDDTMRLAGKYFGTIERREIAPRTYLPEPKITKERRKRVKAAVPQTRIMICYPMAAYGTEEYRVADIITDILASGNSSRFQRELVLGTNLFTHADASISGSVEPGFIMLSGALTANDDATIEAAERALAEQAARLAAETVSEYELERALNRYESRLTMSQLSYVAKARELARSVMLGEDYNSQIENYRSITPDDVRRVAGRLMQPEHSCTLIYRP
ncbi:MAG: insulinase family protein [Bacteroides sp.]|nr:insulinase family protein [Bacteroides sp.]MCM1413620.1 insulinase family protein [Bacteroides sp.]MCM1471163.1 insulinase family protein [Bacteroides sp.]